MSSVTPLSYSDDDLELTGFLVRADETTPEPKPGILLVHGGAGLDDHTKGQAERMTVLTLARAGTDLAGVISMHGALATPRRAEPGAVKAKVLACHGAADPHVPMSDVDAFVEEMEHAGADWQLIAYGGAVHGFTHKDAVTGAIPGVAYDARTDDRSFAAAQRLLSEIFGSVSS